MRPETGVMQFPDDWPGVFIRGDDAFLFRTMLESALSDLPEPETADIVKQMRRDLIGGLIDLLASSDIRNHPSPQKAVMNAKGYRWCPEQGLVKIETTDTSTLTSTDEPDTM